MQFASRDQSKVKHITDLPLAGDLLKILQLMIKEHAVKDDEAISLLSAFLQ